MHVVKTQIQGTNMSVQQVGITKNLSAWHCLFLIASLLCSSLALAKDEIYTGFFSNKAISGYDAVAYFTESQPRKGSRKFQTVYKNTTWLFANREHLELFVASPEQYAPQYGGYCAFGAAMGFKFDGDPNYWRIEDGELYLNLAADIQERWEQDIPGFIQQADANWVDIADKTPESLQQ